MTEPPTIHVLEADLRRGCTEDCTCFLPNDGPAGSDGRYESNLREVMARGGIADGQGGAFLPLGREIRLD